ncbi:DNA gyrase modulator, partial [Planctomycetota bacterium]|nr:DNA gyrase modulator [Planctomycetota bacterium]
DAEQVEVILTSSNVNSTRFSGNVIRENVGLLNQNLRLRVINGKRQGTATVNQLDDESIKRGIASAVAVARVSAEDETLLPMLKDQPEYAASNAWIEETANATPAQRADAVGQVLSDFNARKLEGAGIFDTKENSLAYGNSHGVFAYHPTSKADFTVSAFSDLDARKPSARFTKRPRRLPRPWFIAWSQPTIVRLLRLRFRRFLG